MSLDVSLMQPGAAVSASGDVIYVREGGRTVSVTREEWDARFPGREPATFMGEDKNDCVYDANITHNLNRMANEAGIYKVLWRPEEIGATKAHQLIGLLRCGLELLREDPERFKKFNPKNGWGEYDGLVEFVQKYLEACRAYPDAEIRVSR